MNAKQIKFHSMTRAEMAELHRLYEKYIKFITQVYDTDESGDNIHPLILVEIMRVSTYIEISYKEIKK